LSCSAPGSVLDACWGGPGGCLVSLELGQVRALPARSGRELLVSATGLAPLKPPSRLHLPLPPPVALKDQDPPYCPDRIVGKPVFGEGNPNLLRVLELVRPCSNRRRQRAGIFQPHELDGGPHWRTGQIIVAREELVEVVDLDAPCFVRARWAVPVPRHLLDPGTASGDASIPCQTYRILRRAHEDSSPREMNRSSPGEPSPHPARTCHARWVSWSASSRNMVNHVSFSTPQSLPVRTMTASRSGAT
jgi:hypothetical protein